MKITRNGQEIELTAYELTKAHQEYELEDYPSSGCGR